MKFIIKLFLIITSTLLSQIEYGGTPIHLTNIHQLNLPTINTTNFTRIDGESIFDNKVFVYGDIFLLDLNFFEHAKLIKSNSINTWILEIYSPNAKAIGFKFNHFFLPNGAELFAYPSSGDVFQGSYTNLNQSSNGKFSIHPVKSDKVILELNMPNAIQENAIISIKEIIHDYTDIMAYYSDTSDQARNDCNLNVACPESNGWEQQINAVVRLDMGGGLCSASLINNTNNDLTPYILTANHCISGTPSYYNINFNYQSSACNGSSGSTAQTISGTILRASGDGPDFALLELTNDIPDNYNPFYNGWNRASSSPNDPTGIHHPEGGIKKISFTNDNVSSSWDGNYWEFQFSPGRVIPGSSGSPLFDQNKRTVGIASYIYTNYCYEYNCYCDQQYDAGYGRFDQSWDWGSNSSSRLSDWLDPMNTGTLILDGIDINGFLQPQLDYSITGELDVILSDNESTESILTISNIGEPESILDFSISISPFLVNGDSPDNFGYYWTDTDINPNMDYSWIDISNIGELYTFPHNDQAGVSIDLGFYFPFYNEEYSQCIINPNGWIGFGNDDDSWENTEIPSNNAPNPAILAFWDDLNPINENCNENCSGNVYTYSDNEKFIVWFNNVAHWASADYTESFYEFQIILYSNGHIDISYNNLASNYSPTIGIQDSGGADGNQIYYSANSISNEWPENNKSLHFKTTPEWVAINQLGTNFVQSNLIAGENQAATIIFNNEELPQAVYSAFISLMTNTENSPTFSLNLTATGNPAILGDVNLDEELNVLDVVISVNIILGEIVATPQQTWALDINGDGQSNVIDIVLLINIILEGI